MFIFEWIIDTFRSFSIFVGRVILSYMIRRPL